MHTCGATMIHIISTCGDDSNQKLKCTPANNLKRPDSQRRNLHKVQLWKSRQEYAVFLTVLTRNVCISSVSPLDKTHTVVRAQTWQEIRFKSTNTLNIKTNNKNVQQESKLRRKMWFGHTSGVTMDGNVTAVGTVWNFGDSLDDLWSSVANRNLAGRIWEVYVSFVL